MTDNLSKVLIAVAVTGLFICAYFVYQQSAQLASLQSQLLEQGQHVDRLSDALQISQARQASNIKIRSLPAGVYELSTEVTVDPFEIEKDEYIIYNFVLDISVGAVRRKLQFGYARSGILTHVIYIDHDSDGSIDTNLMSEYTSEIPGFDFAAGWLIESNHSQAVYDAFRLNVDEAAPIKVDDVSGAVDERVGMIWDWLNEQSDALADRVADFATF